MKSVSRANLSVALVLLVSGAGYAHAEQSRVADSKSLAGSDESVYSRLYSMMDALDFEGWNVSKIGFYVDNGGKFKQVMLKAKEVGKKSYQNSKQELLASHSFLPGEEGILKECGCHAVAQKVFRRGNRFVTFEGFQFDRPVGASAGYNFLRSGSTTVLKRGDGSSEDAQSISFWKGNFFFRIFTKEEDDDEAKGVISQIANIVTKKVVSSAGPPELLEMLPTLDRVRGSEKIVLGPLTARHYFSVPYLSELKIEDSRGALVADYQVYNPHRERLKVLYIDYGDPLKAQKAYYNFATNVSQLKAPISGGPTSSPRSLFNLNKRFMLCELKPKGKVLVITNARKKVSPGVFSSQI